MWYIYATEYYPAICCYWCSVTKFVSHSLRSHGLSTPDSSVFHHLPEFAQIHVHWISDAIQASHPLSSPSPFCLQSFPASGPFPLSWLFTPGSQTIGASASVLPMNIQGLFPVGWTGLISLLSKGLLSLVQHCNSKSSILWHSAFFMVQLWHPYMTTGKIIALTMWTFVGKVMSLLFNMLSRFVIAFLPRGKCFLISWLQSLSAVILESEKIKSVTAPTFAPSICHDLSFLTRVLIQLFHSSLSSRGSLVSLHFSAIVVVSSAYLRLDWEVVLYLGAQRETLVFNNDSDLKVNFCYS